MAYEPTIWKDRAIEKPRTFTLQNNPDGTVTLVPVPGTIVEAGTPVNAANLNKLEQGLKTHEDDNAIDFEELRLGKADLISRIWERYEKIVLEQNIAAIDIAGLTQFEHVRIIGTAEGSAGSIRGANLIINDIRTTGSYKTVNVNVATTTATVTSNASAPNIPIPNAFAPNARFVIDIENKDKNVIINYNRYEGINNTVAYGWATVLPARLVDKMDVINIAIASDMIKAGSTFEVWGVRV